MKQFKHKILYIASFITIALSQVSNVFAAGFNSSSAQELISSYTTPILNLLLWALPAGCAIACVASYIGWLLKDEEEKERQKPMRRIKQIIGFGIIAECIVTILAIVGIS